MATTDPLSLRQLELLAALADEGSFTRTARRLGLSQSTVSEHVADLERRLELRLVERRRSGVVPTTAGAALLQHARSAVRAEQALRQAAAALRGVLAGELVVGASSIPEVHLVPERLAAFRAAHPAVELRLRTGSSQRMLAALAAGEIDVAVVGSAPASAALEARAIAHDEIVLICAAGDPLADRDEVERDELLAAPMVLRESGSGTRKAALHALGREPAQVVLEVSSSEAAIAAVRAGLGVSLVSRLAVEGNARDGVVIVPVQGWQAARAFYVVTRAARVRTPAAEAFLQMA